MNGKNSIDLTTFKFVCLKTKFWEKYDFVVGMSLGDSEILRGDYWCENVKPKQIDFKF